MSQATGLITPGGAAVETIADNTRWKGLTEPKGSSPWFGWIDMAGEPATVRVELVAAVAKDARSGRFVIILSNAGISPSITDADAYRLMRRLGWTVENNDNGKS